MGIIKDAKSIAKRDPAARNAAEVFLLYPGLHALIYHKISSFFFHHKLFFWQDGFLRLQTVGRESKFIPARRSGKAYLSTMGTVL